MPIELHRQRVGTGELSPWKCALHGSVYLTIDAVGDDGMGNPCVRLLCAECYNLSQESVYRLINGIASPFVQMPSLAGIGRGITPFNCALHPTERFTADAVFLTSPSRGAPLLCASCESVRDEIASSKNTHYVGGIA